MDDEITIQDATGYAVPREPASDPRFVKHVRCEGARFHVLHWDTAGAHCSESDCIINKPHAANVRPHALPGNTEDDSR